MADESLETTSPWSQKDIRTLRTRLLDFFDEVRRPLPWRESPDPYAVLVSEVMSQQTRVEAVVGYYRRWMKRFPDPASLAAAHEDEVLALWQGLGYYSRARNLHRTAREIEARYHGRVPADPAELLRLPGVGPYTAGAVASMAYGVPVPAVDGNVRRVLARLTDDPAPSSRKLEALAGALVDPERPGDFNQALMELGALVCTPRSPACRRCPVPALCEARTAGTQDERPAPRRRGAVPVHDHAVAVMVAPPGDEGSGEPRFLLLKRPERGLLAGMWAFPEARMHEGESPAAAAARARRLAEGDVAEGDVAAGRVAERRMEEGRMAEGSVAEGSVAEAGVPEGDVAEGRVVEGDVAEAGVAERRVAEGGGHGVAGAERETLPADPLAVVDHAFSHMRVSYHPFVFAARKAPALAAGGTRALPAGGTRALTARGTPKGSGSARRWVTAPESAALALPVAQRRILRDAREYWASRGPG